MNNTSTDSTKTSTFTQVPDLLRRSKKLSDTQKIFISYVLGWENNGKVCFESNETLADNLGTNTACLSKQITKLNKLPFFKSEENSKHNQFGKWQNAKITRVDNDRLLQWLLSDEQQPKEKSTKKPQDIKVAPIKEKGQDTLPPVIEGVLEPIPESVQPAQAPIPPQPFDNTFLQMILNLIIDETTIADFNTTVPEEKQLFTSIIKLYGNSVKQGKLTPSNFDKDKILKYVSKRIDEFRLEQENDFGLWRIDDELAA